MAVREVLEANRLEECHGVGEGRDQAGGHLERLIQCDEGTCCRTGTGTGTVQECLIHSLVVLKKDLPGPWQMIRGTQPGTQPCGLRVRRM